MPRRHPHGIWRKVFKPGHAHAKTLGAFADAEESGCVRVKNAGTNQLFFFSKFGLCIPLFYTKQVATF